jgi:hypothetical protein
MIGLPFFIGDRSPERNARIVTHPRRDFPAFIESV